MADPVLEVLTPEQCRRLLGAKQVGRVGFVRRGYPLILPVNYALHRGRIVIRTGPGAKLSGARLKRVTFEVDHLDSDQQTGWSVLVQGFGTEAHPDQDGLHEEVRALPLHPWAPGEKQHVLLITPISITGRRITLVPRGRPHARRPVRDVGVSDREASCE